MFELLKEIRDRNGELHFRRWNIISTKWFSLYLHCLYKKDEEVHPHSHPWNLWTFILKGGYLERLYNKKKYPVFKKFSGDLLVERGRFSLAYRPAEDYHQVVELQGDKPVWTLALVGQRKEGWGYLTEDGYIDQDMYRRLKWLKEVTS